MCEISTYLARFGDVAKLPRQRLLDELDIVWTGLGLDNTVSLRSQANAVSLFYGHPVWVLNGIFSELDADSKRHRVSIANYIKQLHVSRVADYGGGSGVLASFISKVSDAHIDIVEPYPCSIFVERLNGLMNVDFVSDLGSNYDVVVVQDVLEHVENPLELALRLVSATKMKGHLIFANCFYPDIKCHLPSTFYLRHTFSNLMTYAGLTLAGRVSGAEYALAFRRTDNIHKGAFDAAARRARLIGPLLNSSVSIARKCKQSVKNIL